MLSSNNVDFLELALFGSVRDFWGRILLPLSYYQVLQSLLRENIIPPELCTTKFCTCTPTYYLMPWGGTPNWKVTPTPSAWVRVGLRLPLWHCCVRLPSATGSTGTISAVERQRRTPVGVSEAGDATATATATHGVESWLVPTDQSVGTHDETSFQLQLS